MTGIKPPAGFEHTSLDLEVIPSSSRFGRIYASVFPDPLGFGKTPSRFSDPRRREAARRFGVHYLGDTLKVCFLEAVLRDRRDGLIGDLPIEEDEIHARRFAEIETAEKLRLVDLRDDHAVRMGVPTDVAKSSRQSLARAWSLAFHEHKSLPDKHHPSFAAQRAHEHRGIRTGRLETRPGTDRALDRRDRPCRCDQ
ncbi:RES domain-containing protein [Rhizobium sp. CCGE532]|uniref:RES domain-containing protein n=1 Tax=unclassified Rhizobium TaxID=2613769 RepID=UPI0032AEBD44